MEREKASVKKTNNKGGECGLTLVEIMAAVVISSIIVAAGFTMLTVSQKSTRVIGMVADTQQNVRMAMELISRDIKVAGFGMVGTVGNCTVGAGAAVAAAGLVPNDQAPTGNDAGPDTVSMVVPLTRAAVAAAPAWILTVQANGLDNTITLNPAAVTAMQAAGLTDVGPPVSTISIGGATSVLIGAIAGGVIPLQTPIGVTKTFPVGTPVFLLECVTYAISINPAICGPNSPCLTRAVNGGAPIPLVDGIEDLQLAFACDGCNTAAPNPAVADGVVDTQNGPATPLIPLFDQADFVTNTQAVQWNVAPMTPGTIRLIQIGIVSRQLQPELSFGTNIGNAVNTPVPIVVSDHDPSNDVGFTLNTYQSNRRRFLSRVVVGRNLGP